MQQFYAFLAALVLILHLAFVLFALFGGLLALHYPKVLWMHLPVLLWGLVVEWADWVCPLTPLENLFRVRSGQAGYEGGFIEHWITALLYPQNLTLELRYVLGLVLVALNIAIYAHVISARNKAGRR